MSLVTFEIALTLSLSLFALSRSLLRILLHSDSETPNKYPHLQKMSHTHILLVRGACCDRQFVACLICVTTQPSPPHTLLHTLHTDTHTAAAARVCQNTNTLNPLLTDSCLANCSSKYIQYQAFPPSLCFHTHDIKTVLHQCTLWKQPSLSAQALLCTHTVAHSLPRKNQGIKAV